MLNNVDNVEKHAIFQTYWGVNNTLPQRNFTVSLINDKKDLIGSGPPDTEYQRAIARHYPEDKTVSHCFHQFMINATREHMSAKTLAIKSSKQK